ncbi:MAG TPA: pyridoxamine 5'-phosphate oxidase family protein [Vicinamibacteria bacterium]|nr:pyridoxamine 5'-phosphate oxidase family protein [Vicinamibacteria bacterium]
MRQRVAVLAVTCLLGLRDTAAAAEPAPVPDRAKVLAAAAVVMERARYCSLITLGPDGHPQSRIVDPFPPDPDLTVWIATNPVTRKVEQIKADPRVTLSCFDPSGPGYVTLLARAVLVTDPAEKAKRWKEDWIMFYADKNRGPDYVLIRCKPFRVEVVSYPDGILNDRDSWRPVTIELP